ncbi:hypothetical protein I8H83_00285 [Candidatus Saccharibacteria bacterium]|nr:hypothetical protein [Candidatus Saccharibacteria bacterium]
MPNTERSFNHIETLREDDDSPNEEAVRGLGQISALTIARQNEAMQNINEKRRQQS